MVIRNDTRASAGREEISAGRWRQVAWLGTVATVLLLVAMFLWYDFAGPGSAHAFEQNIERLASKGAERVAVINQLKEHGIAHMAIRPSTLLVPPAQVRGSAVMEFLKQHLGLPSGPGHSANFFQRANTRWTRTLTIKFREGRVSTIDATGNTMILCR